MKKHIIRGMPVDTGRSGWEAISPRPFPSATLDEALTADWLIIGAGFAGLSAARRLTQLCPGDRIVIVDAQDIATGPAGRNSGFMIDVPHNLSSGDYSAGSEHDSVKEIARNRYAIAFAADAAHEYEMSRETFDPSGKTNAAATPRGELLNERYARALAGINEEFRMLDSAEMRDVTGSRYYRSGLYTPGTSLIQPADYIRGFAAGLTHQVKIFERSPVRALERVGKMWFARTDKGSIQAPKVILGVNGHVENFGYFGGRLLHVFTYASMTHAFPQEAGASRHAGRDRWAILPADPMGATVRKISLPDRSGRIVIRTRFTYDPGMEVSARRIAGIAKEQRASFDARFPELKNLGFEFSWAGRLCLSRNGSPAFGEVEEDLFSACCENGLGTVKSTFAGIMAADLATKTPSKWLDEYVAHKKPNRIPPVPLTWLGANALIRWQERRAGQEG